MDLWVWHSFETLLPLPPYTNLVRNYLDSGFVGSCSDHTHTCLRGILNLVNENIAIKKKDDISKIDLVKLISFNTYVQIM